MNPFDSSSDEEDKVDDAVTLDEDTNVNKDDLGTKESSTAAAADDGERTTPSTLPPDQPATTPPASSSSIAAERVRTEIRRSSLNHQNEDGDIRRNRRGHNNIHRPWQYDWKSPTWWNNKKLTNNAGTDTASSAAPSNAKISTTYTATCLDVTSAQVVWEECCHPPQSVPLPNKKYEPEGRNFMLTVSLISSPSERRSQNKPSYVSRSAVGTKIQLELWAYKDQETSFSEDEGGKSSSTSPPSSLFYNEDDVSAIRSSDPTESSTTTDRANKNEMECIMSKVLTWPGSQMRRDSNAYANDSDERKGEQQKKSPWSWVQDLHRNLTSSPVLPLMDFKVSSKSHSEEEENRLSKNYDEKLDHLDGVVSISLCRLKPSSATNSTKKFTSDKEEMEGNIASAATNSSLKDIANAQELINLLSLGGSIGTAAHGHDTSAALSAMLNNDKHNGRSSTTIPPPTVKDLSAPSLPLPATTAISTKESSGGTSPFMTPTSSPGRQIQRQGVLSRSSSQASDVIDEPEDGNEKDGDVDLGSSGDNPDINPESVDVQPETIVDGSNTNGQIPNTDREELRLLCVTRSGYVHVYSPWRLLLGDDDEGDGDAVDNSKESAVPMIAGEEYYRDDDKASVLSLSRSSNDEFMSAMENLFLGSALQERLQDTVLPLCQPIVTMSLTSSVDMNLSKHKDAKTKKGQFLLTSSSADEDDTLVNNGDSHDQLSLDEDREKNSSNKDGQSSSKTIVSLWDPILWNPNVEMSTVKHKTIQNTPTLSCLAGRHEHHLVVAGHGLRPEQYRYRRRVVVAGSKDTTPPPQPFTGDTTKRVSDVSSPAVMLPLSSSTPAALNDTGSGDSNWWTEDGDNDDESDEENPEEGFQRQESLLPEDGWHIHDPSHLEGGEEQQGDESNWMSLPDDDHPGKGKDYDKDKKKRSKEKKNDRPNKLRRGKNSKKKQPPPWKPLADAATARVETKTVTRYHEGGFVTIFSLSHFSETKTLYLPFRPQHISSFSWNGYNEDESNADDGELDIPMPTGSNQNSSTCSFVIVLGSHPSQAMAICLETATTVPYSVIQAFQSLSSDPPSSVEPRGSGDMAQGVMNTRKRNECLNLWKLVTSLRRFQVLPIDIPHHDDEHTSTNNGGETGHQDGKLSSRLLAASSPHDTLPPALLLAYYEERHEDIDHDEDIEHHDHDLSPHPPRHRHIMIVQRTLHRLGTKLAGSSSSSAQMFKVDSYNSEDDPLHNYKPAGSRGSGQRTMAIETSISSRHVARIALDLEEGNGTGKPFDDPLDHLWSYLGQGWCLVGAGKRVYFICWEGSTSSRGAYCFPVHFDGANLSEVESFGHLSLNPVLPLPWLHARNCSDKEDHEFGLPFTNAYQLPPELKSEEEHTHHILESETLGNALDDSIDMDEIVLDALERISGLSYRPSGTGGISDNLMEQMSPTSSLSVLSQLQPINTSVDPQRALSHREKSHQLLRRCESWNQLEDTSYNRSKLGAHFPVVHLVAPQVQISEVNQIATIATNQYLLTLRELVVENGPASPFQEVLSWLATDQHDFFTAASVALDLLRDAESLSHLWNFTDDRIDQDEEGTKLEGLLDGIIPISTSHVTHEPSAEAAVSPAPLPPSTLMTHLADMTVGCLAKGGFPMSTTLLKFLGRNTFYDPARACLMLVATTASAVSDDLQATSQVMGTNLSSLPSKENESVLDRLLWPLRCLLTIGNTRDYLQPALLLLNVTIPDELRRRSRKASPGGELSKRPSLELCKKLAALIVGASPKAAGLFLDLVDERSRSRFWDSIDHETKLELSLTQISTSRPFPLLREVEVRNWAREELYASLKNDGGKGTETITRIPTRWLQKLCVACLRNAGCELENLLVNPSSASIRLSSETDLDATAGHRTVEDDDGLEQHKLIFSGTRNALTEGTSTSSIDEWGAVFLDFDVLISCILILVSRGESWHEGGKYVTAQTLLDAVCHLAGRPTHRISTDAEEDPQFAFDSSTAMIQCALVKNIRAGGYLVGGINGFVLRCCDVLLQELKGITMDEAETIFLEERIPLDVIDDLDSSDGKVVNPSESMFVLTDAHRQILWLLDEYVLSIRTYGEFETTHLRGRVDPVFAARSLFRAWLCLITASSTTEIKVGTEWLITWLRMKLGMRNVNSSGGDRTVIISKQRLVCAALIRALAWPSTIDSSSVISATTNSGVSNNIDESEGEEETTMNNLSSSPSDRLILSTVLQVEPKFLIQLAQSCCGLVESIPSSIADDIIRKASAAGGSLSKQ